MFVVTNRLAIYPTPVCLGRWRRTWSPTLIQKMINITSDTLVLVMTLKVTTIRTIMTTITTIPTPITT